MQTNYHMHTRRCHHATGKDEDYVKSAICNGFDEIGFSDHACWKYDSDYESMIRMNLREFPGYRRSIRRLQRRYKDRIRILFGMEAEYFPAYMDWLLDFCIDQEIDYLVFGNHYIGSDEYGPYTGTLPLELCQVYFDTCIAGMKTGMYACLAHPELILRDGKGWSPMVEEGFRHVCEAARDLDIPLEYNCLGLQNNHELGIEMYPHHKFWEMAASMGCKAIIGMDAHAPEDMNHLLYDFARNYLEGLNMEVVEQIEPIDYRKIREKRQLGELNWE